MATATLKNFFVLPLQGIDFVKLFKEALEKNEETVFELNKQQLDRGQDASGGSLGRYASFKYKNRFQPVDLLLTGEFRRKFTLQEGTKTAEVFSQDEKNDKLTKRYGKDIFGINKQYRGNLAEKIKPVLGELIKKAIGL